MINRITTNQSAHDNAVRAAGRIYREKGRVVSINPDGEKNEKWSDYYIDVIVKRSNSSTLAWIVEIETDDSVSEAEARDQWVDYDKAYTTWFLAVPVESEDRANELIKQFGIKHCTVITWNRNNEGNHAFWDLPGMKN